MTHAIILNVEYIPGFLCRFVRTSDGRWQSEWRQSASSEISRRKEDAVLLFKQPSYFYELLFLNICIHTVIYSLLVPVSKEKNGYILKQKFLLKKIVVFLYHLKRPKKCIHLYVQCIYHLFRVPL